MTTTTTTVQTEAAEPVTRANASRTSDDRIGKPKVCFYGVFGVQNLGNECTLQAILHNLRERLPNADVHAICYRPEDTIRRHNIPAVAICSESRTGTGVQRSGRLRRLTRILFQRIPAEIAHWWKAVQTIRGTSLVIMTGTGMITDYITTPFGYPYDIFMWTLASRLAGARVRFVGVGVGPIYSPLSRMFIRGALSLADLRSYRDEFSRKRIADFGFDSRKDYVFPDLAFSLPKELFSRPSNRTRSKLTVGLGIMDHRDVHLHPTGEEQEAAYIAYREKMCDFITWLGDHGYGIRILQGDSRYDVITRGDVRKRLEERGIRYDEADIVDEDTKTVEELLAQLAQVDLIVSPRFHNLLLGLMFDVPGVSISYDPKNDALQEGIGLGQYRQSLAELDVKKLIEQFTDLEARRAEIKPMIRKRAVEYRELLDKEYALVFGDLYAAHS
jgi:polysaccharide pyruvyl transferase WcaK-like protein